MKRISILACILGLCFISTAWAQQVVMPHAGRSAARHRALKVTPSFTRAQNLQRRIAVANPAHHGKVWDLGTYNNGAWVWPSGTNDFGVVVGFGDDGNGNQHPLAVPLFGPHAGQWFDLLTLGGEVTYFDEPVNQIADTGLVVGYSAKSDGYVHGFAWTEKSEMVDLGTLADIGYPAYNSSYGTDVNKLGTVIVGWSGIETSCIFLCAPLPPEGYTLPVVWTPKMEWKPEGMSTTWKIQKLSTKGYEDFTYWAAYKLNDVGQITGFVSNNDYSVTVAILWNPRSDGKGWKDPMPLPVPDSMFYTPFAINDRGEIAGAVSTPDGIWLPRLWKPLNQARTKYTKPIALATPEGFSNGWVSGINNLGDMVGELWGDAGDQAIRWTTWDSTFAEVIGFPGDGSSAASVSDTRIAVGMYYLCPDETCGGYRGAAVQLH